MDVPDGFVARLFTEARDARRPKMETVLEVIEAAFGQMRIAVRRTVVGPPTWIWEDEEMAPLGFPKYYILSASNSEGVEGYPLLTIRQAYSIRFDTWVSMSSLILGPDEGQITRSVALAMAHHAGAFAGVKYTASAISANKSSPLAGMVAVKQLLNSPAPIVTQESVDEMIGDTEEPREQIDPDDEGKMVN